MDTSNTNIKVVKDNWDDSSESEQEQEVEQTTTNDVNNSVDNQDGNQYENDEAWDFYEGDSYCINCGKYSDVLIIMLESKRIFCYDDCLDKDEIYDDSDDFDDDYDDKYDRKLGLSVSCRRGV